MARPEIPTQMPHSDHHVRRVVLPSGKTIEVVYFDDLTAEPAAQEPRPEQAPENDPGADDPGADLHHCGTCGSHLVYPTDWSAMGNRHWQVELRCPNCEWTGTGVFEQELVDRFDQELDRGTESLVQDLQRLMRANAEHEVELLREALARDLIVPEDF
jgi:hypothetical protein